METNISRRIFLKTAPAVAGCLVPVGISASQIAVGGYETKVRLSLNCYSFNTPLRAGEIDLFDVLDFCARHQLDAIDPTGYYFPGYPEVPANEYINRFKRQAFKMGIEISGTGIRNDFTIADKEKRRDEVSLVKKWIEASARLGAPTLRIFVGVTSPEGYSRNDVFAWMADDIRECAEYAANFGVVLSLQNHYDYIKSANDILRLFDMVGSEWLGLNLDIGSFRSNPYEEIGQTIHLAVTWQIKENVYVDGKQQPTDYHKLFGIIKSSGYRGYLPLETLGPGDPFEKLPVMISQVRTAMHGHF